MKLFVSLFLAADILSATAQAGAPQKYEQRQLKKKLTRLLQAPSNDLFEGAIEINDGFSEDLDTTEATTDDVDTQLNDSCGAPALDASVWYKVTPSDEGVYVVDVSGSDYSAGILVGVGDPGNLSTIACGPYTVAFGASPGETYYILAIDDQGDGSGNGGNLKISLQRAEAVVLDEFNVNRFGKVNSQTGVATISGTFVCRGAFFIEVFVDARQNVGRFTIVGYGFFSSSDMCDGNIHPWSADIYPNNGKFAGGKSLTFSYTFGCGLFDCFDGYEETVVQLKGGPPKKGGPKI